MTSHTDIDQLFERLLPSATAEQVESSRWSVLERVRTGVAESRDYTGQTLTLDLTLNLADYYVLFVLSGGERHGYGIMSELEGITGGATKFGPGTFYTCIARLLKAGLIEESQNRPDPRINDEPRQYYRLTGNGEQVFVAESERLSAAPHLNTPIVRPI
jgi:hypothetical protein